MKPVKLDPDDAIVMESIFTVMGRAWDDRVVAKEIEGLLRRERLLPRGWKVHITSSYERDAGPQDTTDKYSGRFSVYASAHLVAYEAAFGADGMHTGRGKSLEREIISVEVDSFRPTQTGLDHGVVVFA